VSIAALADHESHLLLQPRDHQFVAIETSIHDPCPLAGGCLLDSGHMLQNLAVLAGRRPGVGFHWFGDQQGSHADMGLENSIAAKTIGLPGLLPS
jgi:hypothetical protein